MNTQQRIDALQRLIEHLQKVQTGVDTVAEGTDVGVIGRLSRVNDALSEAQRNARTAQNLLRVRVRSNNNKLN